MYMFSLPRLVYYGEGALRVIGELAENMGWKRVLLISDSTIDSISFTKTVIEALEEKGVKVELYSRVEPEPTFEQAEEIGSLALKFKPDAMIALGGGSVIDAAKGAWVKYEKEAYDLHSISPFERLGLGKKCTLVAIPTTSGTGSEATLGIVLSEVVKGKKKKIALGSLELVPEISILDPELTVSMPEKLTVATGVDALSHAIEALASTGATEFTDALAIKSIEILYKHLPETLKKPRDKSLKSKIHLASFMAGVAFSNSGLGLAHAIAHAIGPIAKLPHGTSVGIVLPEVVKFNSRIVEVEEKYNITLKILKTTTNVREDRLEEFLLSLYSRIGQARTVKEAGGDVKAVEECLEEIVEDVYQDPDLAFNPLFPSKREVENIILKVLR